MTDRPAPSGATLAHAPHAPDHRVIFARFVDRLAARLGGGATVARRA